MAKHGNWWSNEPLMVIFEHIKEAIKATLGALKLSTHRTCYSLNNMIANNKHEQNNFFCKIF